MYKQYRYKCEDWKNARVDVGGAVAIDVCDNGGFSRCHQNHCSSYVDAFDVSFIYL